MIIGSSNVYRFYNQEAFKEYGTYKMQKCTNEKVFKVAMDEVTMDKGEVLISVIENFLADSVKLIRDEKIMEKALEDAIECYLNQIKKKAVEKPNVKFGVVQPLQRPVHGWYSQNLDLFCKTISEGITRMGCPNVSKLETLLRVSQIFEDDGVHLTPTSGRLFVNAILFAADNFFKTEIVNLGDEAIESVEEDMDTSPVVLLARSTESVDLARRIKTVEGEIDQLRNNLYKRQLQDSMVTARIREELDFQANIKKEDRIIMTGVTSKTPMPNQAEEKKHG
jgi:hypothetical protein